MKYIYGKRIKTFKDRATTLIASLAILANSAGVALPVLLTQKAAAAPMPTITNLRYSTMATAKGSSYDGIVVDVRLNGFSDATSCLVSIHRADGTDATRECGPDSLTHINSTAVAVKSWTTPFNVLGSSDSAWYSASTGVWNTATVPTGATIRITTTSHGDITETVSNALVTKNGDYASIAPQPVSPVVKSISPSQGSYISGKSQRININAEDAKDIRSGYLMINKKPAIGNPANSTRINYPLQQDTDGQWYAIIDTTILEDGASYLFKVEAHGFGNVSHGYYGNNSAWFSHSYHFVVDNTNPTFEILSPVNGNTVSGTVTIKSKITDDSDITKVLMNIGGVSRSWTNGSSSTITRTDDIFSTTIDTNLLPDGPVWVTLRGTDGAGNTRYWNNNAKHRQHVFYIDNTAPVVQSAELSVIGSNNITSAAMNTDGKLKLTIVTDEPIRTSSQAFMMRTTADGGEIILPRVNFSKIADNKYEAYLDLTHSKLAGAYAENMRVRLQVWDIEGNASGWLYVSKEKATVASGASIYKFGVDNAAPNAKIISPIDGSVFRGGTLTVTGSVSDTAGMSHYSIYLYDGTVNLDDGEVHSSSRVTTPGGWTAGGETSVAGLLHKSVSRTLDLSVLNEGEYQIRLAVRDLAGNRTSADSVDVVRFTVDKTPPTTPTITAPGARQWLNGSSTTNSWTPATDENGIAQYEVKYEYVGRSTGYRYTSKTSRKQTFTGSYQGPITISVRAQDKAGNWSPFSKAVTYNYDSVDPATDINVSPVVNGVFTVSGDASDNLALNRVYVQLVSRETNARCGGTTLGLIGQGTNAAWSQTYDISTLGANCPEGEFAAHVSVVDMAGNSSTAGWTSNFLVDATAPVVLVDNIEAINTGNNATVTGTVDDPGVTSVEILVNGVLEGTAGVTAGAFSFNVSGLDVGNHNITVRATDTAGNVGEATKSVQVNAVVLGDSTNTPSNPGGGRGGAGSDGGSITTTSTVTRTSTTNSRVIITDNNSDGDTYAEETTEEPEAQVLQATDTANDSDTSDENETEENNGCGKFLGLCWYLWIPIVIVVLGTVYYFSSRRADEK